jgi:hypothetical protein
MACDVALAIAPHGRAQNRLLDADDLRCALRSDRPEDVEWLMPGARSMGGR